MSAGLFGSSGRSVRRRSLKTLTGRWGSTPFHVLLLTWTALVVGPLVWVGYTSLKSSRDILIRPWAPPVPPEWGNYVRAWEGSGLGPAFLRSVVITLISVTLILLISAMVSYVLARFRFRGHKLLYYFLLSGLVLPTYLAMAPLYLLMDKLAFLNNYVGLIMVYIAYSLPFTVFLLTAFFRTIPESLAEAAVIDGCTPFGVFWRVMLPLAQPGLVAAGIFNIVGIWNEYVLAFILLTDEGLWTLPVALGRLTIVQQYQTDWAALYAGVVIAIVPVVIAYILFQRQLIGGTVAGALKG